MAWTSDDLCLDVRNRAQLPPVASDGAFTDADLLTIADEEIATRVVPFVRSMREDYWVSSKDFTPSASTTSFTIPKRSQSATLRDVLLVNTSTGDETSVPYVALSEAWRFKSTSGMCRFYLQDGRICLVGDVPTSGYTLRCLFYRRHPSLVAVSSCAAITTVNAGSVVCGSTPITTGTYTDLVGKTPPFLAFGDDLLCSLSVSTYSLTLDGSAYDVSGSGVAVGDYLCPADQSCIVQLPTELYSALVRLVVGAVLEARGDRQAAVLSYQLADQIMTGMRGILRPRVDGEAKHIVRRNSPLRLRSR